MCQRQSYTQHCESSQGLLQWRIHPSCCLKKLLQTGRGCCGYARMIVCNLAGLTGLQGHTRRCMCMVCPTTMRCSSVRLTKGRHRTWESYKVRRAWLLEKECLCLLCAAAACQSCRRHHKQHNRSRTATDPTTGKGIHKLHTHTHKYF